jgi:hypothetical protein
MEDGQLVLISSVLHYLSALNPEAALRDTPNWTSPDILWEEDALGNPSISYHPSSQILFTEDRHA